MTQAPSAKNGAETLKLLPALTLLLVLSVFAMQTILVSGEPQAEVIQLSSPETSNPMVQAELPTLGQIQPFELTERSGKVLTQAQLQDKIWIADFIFTSCQSECPLMSAEMQKLQQTFAAQPKLRFVSFSVDPSIDTPERLRSYAAKYGADAERWLFFTGKQESLYAVASQSFKLAVQDLRDQKGKAPDSGPFLHSQKFVLVDGQLRIRGYYDSNDPASIRTLIEKDVPQLLQHP